MKVVFFVHFTLHLQPSLSGKPSHMATGVHHIFCGYSQSCTIDPSVFKPFAANHKVSLPDESQDSLG
jgi:hypothetical protein